MHFQAAAKSFWACQWCDDFKLDKILSHCHWMCFMWNKNHLSELSDVFFFVCLFTAPPFFFFAVTQVTSGISSCVRLGLPTNRGRRFFLSVITWFHVIKTPFQPSSNCMIWMPFLAASTIISCVQLKCLQWILNVQEWSSGPSCFCRSSRCCGSFSGVHLWSIQLIGHDPERFTPV